MCRALRASAKHHIKTAQKMASCLIKKKQSFRFSFSAKGLQVKIAIRDGGSDQNHLAPAASRLVLSA